MKPKSNVLVPSDRIISRGQGCWNCKHWDREVAKPRWTHNRQRDLNTALSIALTSPTGEDDPRVVNVRAMVDDIDHLVAQGYVGVCQGGGKTEDGNPVGDLVLHQFLCGQWSGRSGASLATGGKLDALPLELADKLNKVN